MAQNNNRSQDVHDPSDDSFEPDYDNSPQASPLDRMATLQLSRLEVELDMSQPRNLEMESDISQLRNTCEIDFYSLTSDLPPLPQMIEPQSQALSNELTMQHGRQLGFIIKEHILGFNGVDSTVCKWRNASSSNPNPRRSATYME